VISIAKTGRRSADDYIIAVLGIRPLHAYLTKRTKAMLNHNDHSRDSVGLTYIYPVISRRAGGVSIGINLNTNNACNWACLYCQVPDLIRGGPPPIDLEQLEAELRTFLHAAIDGDFLAREAPPEARRLMDIAFSGNGEPSSAAEFGEAVALVETVLRDFNLLDTLKIRLITNGSLLHRPAVRRSIRHIGALNGEVWFKIDRATTAGIALVNNIKMTPQHVRTALLTCAELAPTWVQTCYFAIDGEEASEEEQHAYLKLIKSVATKIEGVHLYGLARPSRQASSQRLSNVPQEKFLRFAKQITALGLEVVATP
jgi:wyosine [tRNA(Phe)-imidazoG37] synthetase (radical SAM superfamily)